MNDSQAIVEMLERIRSRYYGKYRGTVTDVEQGGRGRIKAKVPAVLGEQKTGWCDPCVPFAGPGMGILFLPEVGAGVWIEFEAGDLSHPIWAGCYFREGELPEDAGPQQRAIVTKAGHKLIFDDDQASITLADSNGNSATLDDGGITLTRGSSKLEVAESKVSVNDGALEVQ